MFYINSPLSQFEVSNLIGIFTPILDKLNFIPYNLALYSDIFENFSYLTKPEFWGSIMGYIVNNLFTGVFFEYHISCIIGAFIGAILLITIIILIGARTLESKPINEGIKTVINLGVCALTGIALANAGNSRDDDERRRKEEEEQRRREEEERRREEERRKREEEQERRKEEETKTENDKKGKGKGWW